MSAQTTSPWTTRDETALKSLATIATRKVISPSTVLHAPLHRKTTLPKHPLPMSKITSLKTWTQLRKDNEKPTPPPPVSAPTEIEYSVSTVPESAPTDPSIEDTCMADLEESKHSGFKYTHNSDSDHNLPQHRPKMQPQPNLSATRPRKSNTIPHDFL